MKNGRKEKLYTSFIARLGESKKLEFCVYAAIVAAALIAFAASGGISCGERNKSAAEEPVIQYRSEDEIESRLEEILSGIDGAGRVRVMLQYENASESVPASVQETSGFSLFGASGSDGTESRPAAVCGALIVAEGADCIRVRNELQSAVRTLLGLDLGRIGVYTMQCEPEDFQPEN